MAGEAPWGRVSLLVTFVETQGKGQKTLGLVAIMALPHLSHFLILLIYFLSPNPRLLLLKWLRLPASPTWLSQDMMKLEDKAQSGH